LFNYLGDKFSLAAVGEKVARAANADLSNFHEVRLYIYFFTPDVEASDLVKMYETGRGFIERHKHLQKIVQSIDRMTAAPSATQVRIPASPRRIPIILRSLQCLCNTAIFQYAIFIE
jgi:hypothetical protein